MKESFTVSAALVATVAPLTALLGVLWLGSGPSGAASDGRRADSLRRDAVDWLRPGPVSRGSGPSDAQAIYPGMRLRAPQGRRSSGVHIPKDHTALIEVSGGRVAVYEDDRLGRDCDSKPFTIYSRSDLPFRFSGCDGNADIQVSWVALQKGRP